MPIVAGFVATMTFTSTPRSPTSRKPLTTTIERGITMDKRPMSFDEVMDVIRSLARSQGSYGRLYYSILEMKKNNPEEYAYFKDDIAGQMFTDIIDVIMYFES